MNYQLDTQVNQPDATGLTNSPTVTVPTFSLDSGIIFEKKVIHYPNILRHWSPGFLQNQTIVNKTSYLTLIPKKSSSYTQLFRENRFAGGDRISDDQRLTLDYQPA